MNQDLSKLQFPLFETTELEKKLLRKAELYLIKPEAVHSALCSTLNRLPVDYKLVQSVRQWQTLIYMLQRKIKHSLGGSAYLENALRRMNGLPTYLPVCRSPSLLRRYWITLLLNYNPKDKKHD